MEDEFVPRVCKIPLVSSAIGRLGCWYTHGKANHTVFRLACETAEIGLRVAVYTTKPLINKLEQPIGRLNQIACCRLNQLEASYPIINTPTEQVVSRVKQVFTGVLAILTFDRIEGDDIDAEGSDQQAAGPSTPVTVRLLTSVQNATCVVINPSVLFTFTDKLLVATEKCLHQQYSLVVEKYGELSPLAKHLQLTSVADHLYSRASKQLDCYVSFILHNLLSQSQDAGEYDGVVVVDGGYDVGYGADTSSVSKWLPGREYLLQLIDSVLGFIISHSPLMFLAPDFGNYELVPELDDDYVDDEGNIVQGVVGYVPLNPADLAALPPIRLRRNCWRRRP